MQKIANVKKLHIEYAILRAGRWVTKLPGKQKMEWQEINCIVEALTVLIVKYDEQLQDTNLDEDDRSDISNDLAHTQILLGNYKQKRD